MTTTSNGHPSVYNSSLTAAYALALGPLLRLYRLMLLVKVQIQFINCFITAISAVILVIVNLIDVCAMDPVRTIVSPRW